MSLDRNAILFSGKPPVLPREEVDVPEWGGSVWVRTLSAFERDELERAWEATKRRNFRARLVVATVCDEHGKDIFELGDIEALGRHASTTLGRVFEVAVRLNKFTRDEVEDLEKNSASTPGIASSSG